MFDDFYWVVDSGAKEFLGYSLLTGIIKGITKAAIAISKKL